MSVGYQIAQRHTHLIEGVVGSERLVLITAVNKVARSLLLRIQAIAFWVGDTVKLWNPEYGKVILLYVRNVLSDSMSNT